MAIAKLTTAQSHHVNVNEESGRANFFQSCVERMLTYWREHDALKNLDITILDRERNRILKNITLGLDLQPLWPLVKALVLAFAPYMERRGFWDAWHSVLKQAIHMAQRANDIEAETTLTAYLARLCQRMSRTADVVRYYRRVIQLARQTGNRFEEARACSNLGYLYIDGGHWWRSEVLSQHALAIFEELRSAHGRAHTHNHLGILYIRRQQWEAAKTHLLLACQLWQEMNDQHSLIYGYESLGLLYINLQEPESALEYLHHAAVKISDTGENAEIANVWQNMAYAYRLHADYPNAQTYGHRAESLFRQNSDYLGLARAWHNLAIVYLLLDDGDTAEIYKTQSATTYQQLGNNAGMDQLLNEFVSTRSRV